MQEKKLYLLDAMALIYRAYFAFSKNPRFNSAKLNTSAIFGFTNTLVDLLKSANPSHIAVAFDTQAPTLRHQEFEAYKAQRESMPEDLALSIPYIKKVIEAFNIPVVFKDGFEADDVIGTLAKQAEKEGFKVYMVTPDKDFGQLVSENIFIYKPAKGGNPFEIWGVKEVCERFAIKEPMQLTDIIGLWGDASDNIPGVPGIGEVWAKKLIGQFESVENLIALADKIENKNMREKIINHAEQALLSKNLGTIVTDAPVGFDSQVYEYKGYNQKMLSQLFDELEFKGLGRRVFNSTQEAPTTTSKTATPDLFSQLEDNTPQLFNEDNRNNLQNLNTHYKILTTEEEIASLITLLDKSNTYAFAVQATGTDISRDELMGLAFSVKNQEAYYVVLPDNYDAAHRIVQHFKSFFQDNSKTIITYNVKFDLSMLKNYDIDINGHIFDIMLAHYVIEPDMRHTLTYLAESILAYTLMPETALISKNEKNKISLKTVDINILSKYACEKTDIIYQLKNVLEKQMIERKVYDLFKDVEIPLAKVLSAIELEGVKIDADILGLISSHMDSDVKQLEKDIHTLAGETFNIASHKQLGDILFDKLELVKKAKLTKTKQYSTSEDVLSKLVGKHEIVEKILEYRSLTKLKSTYIDALPLLISERTGRIHSSFNQAVAATGRLSSNNPNLQNIPIRTEKGKEIRTAFVPRNKKFILLAADYSQIELRLMAEFSKDPSLIEAFEKGLDIHAATASKIYNIPLEDVNADLRRIAKTVNFGIIYGISSFGLSERIPEINRNEAARLIEQYFIQYPGIKAYMDKTIAFARENQYVETILKRRRYIRDINSHNANVRGFAERNAINAPIQGSAADMIKLAMLKIFNEFNQRKLKSKMIMQVHDELVFDVFLDELEDVKKIVTTQMKNALSLNVPVEIDMKTGQNWLEAH